MPPSSQPTLWPRLRVALLALFIATGLGLFASAMHFVGMQMGGSHPTWGHALGRELPTWYVWLVIYLGVQWFTRRYRIERPILIQRLVQHIGFGIAMIVLHATIMVILQGNIGLSSTRRAIVILNDLNLAGIYWLELGLGLTTRILSYGAVVGIALARDFYDQFQERASAASRLTTQLAVAQLAALRMQLHPHFLFNTLNTIAMLVRGGKDDQAVTMLTRLSDLLRTMLDENPIPIVPFREEVEFVGRYLAIEQVRFHDRLRVEIDVPASCQEALVPTLILQPIVENAIRHGIARRATAGHLLIRAHHTKDNRLHIVVADDGAGLPPGDTPCDGVGLANTRQRLVQSYGAAHALDLRPRSPGPGTEAHIIIPYRLLPEAADGEV